MQTHVSSDDKNNIVQQALTSESDEEMLAALRDIILGQDQHLITQIMRSHARELVANVVVEALHDRQLKDQSVDKILQPVIEQSVERSVETHSDKFVGYFYPIVGSLVRKSVKAFLSNFIEKTNQMLEHSLTVKGIQWRIKARQANVSFAQYAVSQTYQYRVEHVFLIHRETGLLLKSVSHPDSVQTDPDLISSMLTAISDFVSDSFAQPDSTDDEQLETIVTDNYTLLIKPGPYATLVASVTGQAPSRLSEKMQLSMEQIHQLYQAELSKFNGDNAEFEQSEGQLSDCLIAEEKLESKEKKPWMAWILLLILGGFLTHWGWRVWQSQQIEAQLSVMDTLPGYSLQKLNVDFGFKHQSSAQIELLRDPDSVPVKQWLANQQITLDQIEIKEKYFHSVEPSLITQRLSPIKAEFTELEFNHKNGVWFASGKVPANQKYQLLIKLGAIGLSEGINLDLTQLQIQASNTLLAQSQQVSEQALFQILAKINAIQIDFELAEVKLAEPMLAQLNKLTQLYQMAKKLAEPLNYQLNLVVVGTSDASGPKQMNQKLSIDRANSVRTELVKQGISQDEIYTTGVSQLDNKHFGSEASQINTRKALFNVMYLKQTQNTERKI